MNQEHKAFRSLGECRATNRGSLPASKWARKLGITSKQVYNIMLRDGKYLTECYSRRTTFYAIPGIRAGKMFSPRLFENFKATAKMIIPESKKNFWGFVAQLEKYPVTNN